MQQQNDEDKTENGQPREPEPTPESPTGATGFFVSQGAYSDYSVVALFTTRALAEEFVAARAALGTLYRTDAGEWEPSKYAGYGYGIEEGPLDPVFGARGCYVATLTIQDTHPASIPWHGTVRGPAFSTSSWDEDANETDAASSMRNPFYGCTNVMGYGATRESAFAAANALRTRIMSAEVDPPWPAFYTGPK